MLVCSSQELVVFGLLGLWPLRIVGTPVSDPGGLAENSADGLAGGPLPDPLEPRPRAGIVCVLVEGRVRMKPCCRGNPSSHGWSLLETGGGQTHGREHLSRARWLLLKEKLTACAGRVLPPHHELGRCAFQGRRRIRTPSSHVAEDPSQTGLSWNERRGGGGARRAGGP